MLKVTEWHELKVNVPGRLWLMFEYLHLWLMETVLEMLQVKKLPSMKHL